MSLIDNKKCETSESVTTEYKLNIINTLDDDSLICIFRNLNVKEKLIIELVCKRFKNIGILS